MQIDGRQTNGDGLLSAVTRAFWEYPEEKLKLQCAYMYAIYREIMVSEGEINYKLPYDGTRKRQREMRIFEDPYLDKNLFLKTTDVFSKMLISSSDEEEVDLI